MNKKNAHSHEGHHPSHGEPAPALKTAAEIAVERSGVPPGPLLAVEPPAMAAIPQKELDELRTQAAKTHENWDRLLRAQADLENYRKRVARERQHVFWAAREKLLLELLAPLDHFEMGLQSVGKNSAEDPLRHGMKMVLAQFQQFLKSQGVTEIQALGQMFDPALHEAVGHEPSKAPEGQVIQQHRKGYRLDDKLLRAATVVVSKGQGVLAEQPPAEVSSG